MYVPVSAADEAGFCRCSLDACEFCGSASLALDSIDVRWAGNSGVCSDPVGILVGVERYCEVDENGSPCRFPEIDGGTKAKDEPG